MSKRGPPRRDARQRGGVVRGEVVRQIVSVRDALLDQRPVVVADLETCREEI